jgi:hypothetical protein
MPSTIVGIVSGAAQILVSGNVWSGQRAQPNGGIQLRLSPESSGNVYVGFSGSLTVNSGGPQLSGGGLNDGMIIRPGDSYFIPKIKFPVSGQCTVYMRHDAGCSGQGRMYWDAF